MKTPIIVWFRQDLRVRDNPALWHAAQEEAPILPIYILEEKGLGGAQKVWLHHALSSLMERVPLILLKGDPLHVIRKIQDETHAPIYYNRCYEPHAIKIEKQLDHAQSYNGSLLVEPWEVAPKSGPYFKVFTPFWRRCLEIIHPGAPLPEPKAKYTPGGLKSEDIKEWNLIPTSPDWSKEMTSFWDMSEEGAHQRLEVFTREALVEYGEHRDYPALDGTSRISPYLHYGQISPKYLWHSLKDLEGAAPYLRELGWREFSYHLLYHFPQLPTTPFNKKFARFDWNVNEKLFRAWTHGMTGYPIVDAGMRQLWKLGWMHNRVRMIVASFLTKDLLIPWQKGAEWFWDTLVDADLANNSASWQWVAGSGADAAPYFRIFNPVLQGQKFDPDGSYVKKWIPELRNIDPKVIHDPEKFEAPGYPRPIVNHKDAKEEALRRYNLIKS